MQQENYFFAGQEKISLFPEDFNRWWKKNEKRRTDMLISKCKIEVKYKIVGIASNRSLVYKCATRKLVSSVNSNREFCPKVKSDMNLKVY